jgi:cytochrome c oxidase cbb3-type subunit 2
MATNAFVGVPYTDEHDRDGAGRLLEPGRSGRRSSKTDADALERYPGNAQTRNFDGQPQVTEMDALIAYLQMLGTMVDFSTFTPDASR